MKITLLTIGKITQPFIAEGIALYQKRIKHYIRMEMVRLADRKKAEKSPEAIKKRESELIMNQIKQNDFVVLLDEKGNEFSSIELSNFVQQKMNHSIDNLVFVTGGPFGFSNDVYQRANFQLALSRMTLPHELVQLFFMEQLYRAFTIIKNEKYHHE